MSENMDRISQLPEAIMEQIVFLLPDDAIRMSFFSRAWQALRNSLPVSCFDFSINLDVDDIRLKEIVIPTERFTSSVDEESLKILQHQKMIIHYFRLRTPHWRLLFDSESSERQLIDHLDRWLKLVLVTGNFIKQLDIVLPLPERSSKYLEETLSPIIRNETVTKPNWLYTEKVIQWYFPPKCFDVSSLVVLRLSNCLLLRTLLIPKGDTRFSCLKELRLENVYFEEIEVTRDLLSKCPSLETLELICCHYDKNSHLQVCGLSKLKKFVIKLIVGTQLGTQLNMEIFKLFIFISIHVNLKMSAAIT